MGTPVGIEAASYFQQGRLVPDDLVLDLVRVRLEQPDCEPGCLFDGFPRTVSQAQKLDELLAGRGQPLDLELEIHVDQQELERRLEDRGRGDDSPTAIRRRLKQYHQLTMPVLEYYRHGGKLRSVVGEGTPDEVFVKILEVIEISSR
jgi:adenylate kinase